MPSPVVMLAFVVALVASFVAGHMRGEASERAESVAKIQTERLTNLQKARETEAMWQGVVNGTVKNYTRKVAGIQSDLDDALERLRARPERTTGAPATPRADCPCATGAELCREDAEFLSREAARADNCRAGLESAYEVIDKVK